MSVLLALLAGTLIGGLVGGAVAWEVQDRRIDARRHVNEALEQSLLRLVTFQAKAFEGSEADKKRLEARIAELEAQVPARVSPSIPPLPRPPSAVFPSSSEIPASAPEFPALPIALALVAAAMFGYHVHVSAHDLGVAQQRVKEHLDRLRKEREASKSAATPPQKSKMKAPHLRLLGDTQGNREEEP